MNAQAERKEFEGAFTTVLLLKNVDETDYYGAGAYVHSISEILDQLVRSGRTKEALETILRSNDLKPHRQSLYVSIASAQADSGDIHGARSTLSLAETEEQRKERQKEITRLIPLLQNGSDLPQYQRLRDLQSVEYRIHPAHRAIALAYAKNGSLTEATSFALDSTFPDRESLFEEIAKTATKSGYHAQAIPWARALSSNSDKAYALLGIAKALSSPKGKRAE